MKKLLLIVTLTLSVTLFAQKQIDEGVVISKQTMSSENEQMNAQLAMLGDMITTTYFKNDKSRSEMSNPMTGTTVFIADNAAKKSLTLMDNAMVGKKYMENNLTPSEEDLKGITIEKTDETKTILGYECTKYNVTMNKDGANVTMVIYATDKLKAVTQQTTAFGKDFTGFPMLMDLAVEQQGVKMNLVIEVTEVKAEDIADDKFDMTVPEGYSKSDKLPGM
ncbi:hypothetical protein LX77_03017 [Gelidibacter algens]|uniref:DUF4412 domain-containing protein n=1 Tax=Gelidibacter algens TaxID=49280 RepID=A0A1A7QSR2_9FLAO|nr:DUF4412 domain-containing protein [Gelidibacter algens]OBX22244.1 hypothetical protein A9996_17170 [Gelidibacter algens]RAJ20758.1 hypothetical protein LX77_03017 [Gelidibacter algens]